MKSNQSSEYFYKSETGKMVHKSAKHRLSNHATSLASNLFSYYKNTNRKKSAKTGSAAFSKSNMNLFEDSKRESGVKSESETRHTNMYSNHNNQSISRITSAHPNNIVMREKMPAEIRPPSEYSMDIAKYSTANNMSMNLNINQSLPTLPENIKQNILNKSVSKMGDHSTKSKYKRKFDISRLASNLNMKD
jgi:hypothetical protein